MTAAFGILGTRMGFGDGAMSRSTYALDSTGDAVAFMFQALTTDAITGVVIGVASETGTPPTYIAALEGVTIPSAFAPGEPDGTVKGGGSPASATFTPSGWGSSCREITFSNSYTPTLGEWLTVTIKHSSGTVNSSNKIDVTTYCNAHRSTAPCAFTSTTGSSWTSQLNLPAFGIVAGSTRYGTPFYDISATTMTTSGHRQGVKFTLPAGWGDTFTCSGAALRVNAASAYYEWKTGIWEGTTEKAGIAVNQYPSSTRFGHVQYFTSQPTLSFGTAYYLAIQRGDDAVGLYAFDAHSSTFASHWWQGNPASIQWATFNGTSWTDDATMIPADICPLLYDITEPAGGGGNKAMLGGMGVL